MKHLKFLMVALTLLMGISFTSCLDSGNSESAYDGYGYVRTVNYMGLSYFVDLQGNKYYPTQESLAAMKTNGFEIDNADLVVIYYKDVEQDAAAGGASATEKYISLVAVDPIDSYRALSVNTVGDMESRAPETAPIVTLEPRDNYGNTYSPLLYGSEMIVLFVNWRMENKNETLKQHTFNLVYVEEAQKDSNELVLYFRHDKGSDTKTEVAPTMRKAFDIKSIMNELKAKSGKYPEKIVVKAKVSVDGEKMPDEYTDYVIDSSLLNK